MSAYADNRMRRCGLTGIREAITVVGNVLRTGRHAGHRRAALRLPSTTGRRPRVAGPLAAERGVEDRLVVVEERGHVAVRARPERERRAPARGLRRAARDVRRDGRAGEEPHFDAVVVPEHCAPGQRAPPCRAEALYALA